jgi:GTP-binding protein
MSSARPKIADYHFTTLTPNLGIVDVGGEGGGFIMADIPGLIEGASKGAGLGDAFLRHVERTRLLLHVVDVAGTEGRDAVEDFRAINRELGSYKVDLSGRPQIVVANKVDALPPGEAGDFIGRLRREAELMGYEVFAVSAVASKGVRELAAAAAKKLRELDEMAEAAAPYAAVAGAHGEPSARRGARKAPRISLGVDNGIYVLSGEWLSHFMAGVNISSHDSMQYFHRTLRRYGIIDLLKQRGVKEGDTVRIFDFEFTYAE